MALFKKANKQEKLVKQSHLQVKTELEALNLIFQWFEIITKNLLPEQAYWQCQLVLAEGFTNTVLHAHQDLPSITTIDLEVSLFPHWLEIRIWDWGQPFNLENKLKSPAPTNQDSLEKEAGRGLQLMKHFTDNLQYIRMSDQRNCLIMRKSISKLTGENRY